MVEKPACSPTPSIRRLCADTDCCSYVFAQFQIDLVDGARRNPASKTIPTYLSVFIFGFLYELYLVWDALRLRNTIQVIGVCFFNIGILSYAAIQTNQIKSAVAALVGQNQMRDTFWQDVRPFLVAVPCVIGLFTLIMAFIARKLYGEFAWTIYKHISADLRMKRRYLAYQVFGRSSLLDAKITANRPIRSMSRC